MKLRAWLDRGVIVIAALATMATSRPRWRVEATLPPDNATTSRIVVVEATSAPELWTEGANATLLEPTTWPGTGRYLVRSSTTLRGVFVSERCSGGSACKDCKPPSDAKVRVVSITPVQTWTLQTTKSPDQQPTQLEPEKWTTYKIRVDASHPVRLTVKSSGPQATVGTWGGEFHVDFGTVQVPTTVTWSVTATIEEPCVDLTACAPPAGANVEITTIVREVQ